MSKKADKGAPAKDLDVQLQDVPPAEGQQAGEQAGEQAATQAGLQILAQYVKDMSFESPLAPAGAPKSEKGQEVRVEVNVSNEKVGDTDHQVGLKFRVEAVSGETKVFIVELFYCGLFRPHNIPEDQLQPVLMIEAPRQLFPFARRILGDMTRDGNFPPLMLDPIDFVQIYRRSEQIRQEQDQQKAVTVTPEGKA